MTLYQASFTLQHYDQVDKTRALQAMNVLFPNAPEQTLEAIMGNPPGYKIQSSFHGEKSQLDLFVAHLHDSGIVFTKEWGRFLTCAKCGGDSEGLHRCFKCMGWCAACQPHDHGVGPCHKDCPVLNCKACGGTGYVKPADKLPS